MRMAYQCLKILMLLALGGAGFNSPAIAQSIGGLQLDGANRAGIRILQRNLDRSLRYPSNMTNRPPHRTYKRWPGRSEQNARLRAAYGIEQHPRDEIRDTLRRVRPKIKPLPSKRTRTHRYSRRATAQYRRCRKVRVSCVARFGLATRKANNCIRGKGC